MKKHNVILFALFNLTVFILGACNLQMAGSGEPAQTEAPDEAEPATEAPKELASVETIAPVDLTGPPMEVGSTYLFVDGATLVAVPAGEFIMGNGRDDSPIKTVTLDEFWIYQAPVTNRQYAFCESVGQCTSPDLKENLVYSDPYRANDPVVGVDWSQAANYCEFVHGRLPTEAEWEKAARGPDGNTYPWGEASPTCDYLNIGRCVGQTTDVTIYPQGASYYSALDMSGNVYEWVSDWYYAGYYETMPLLDPTGPVSGDKRSVRSSSFRSDAFMAEAARRFAAHPDEHSDEGGFRCVVESEHLLDFAPYCEWVTIYGPAGIPPVGDADHPTIVEEEACPPISIDPPAQYCEAGDTPMANVTFHGPPGSTIDPGGCTFSHDSTYVCDAPTHVEICSDCQMVLVQEANCPDGYHLDGDTCRPSAVVGVGCVPGFTYDPVSQCCALEAEAPPHMAVSPCPVGTFYADPPGACVSFPAAGNICVPMDVTMPTCGHHGGDDDDECVRQACGGQNPQWCESLCACIGPADPCP